MNKILHSEDDFVISTETGILKAKSTRLEATVPVPLHNFKLLRQFALQESCNKFMFVIREVAKLPDNYLELFASQLSEDDLSFFYEFKIAIVSARRHFNMFQLFAQYAKSLNLYIDVFLTMKEAKAWLLQTK